MKKVFGSGMTTLMISNKEKKIDQSLQESGLLLKRVSETIKNEVKKQRGRFLGMLLGTLGSSLLGIWTGFTKCHDEISIKLYVNDKIRFF